MTPDAAAPAPARAPRPSPAARLAAFARSPRVALAAALLGALAQFLFVFGAHLLSASDPYWANPPGDMGQMVAGELAGLRAPWSLPLLVTRTLIAPDPVSLVYTDSIPWLTALLKLLHLGPVVSLLGTALLLAWLAQAGAMYALLRACGVERRWTLFAGAVLALLVPAFLARQIGHVALSAHAIQIAALALAVRVARRGVNARGLAVFIALGLLAVGVHAYHAPVVTGLFAAALACDALQRRPGALRRAGVGLAAYLAAVGLAAWMLGYTVGRGRVRRPCGARLLRDEHGRPGVPAGLGLAGHRWTGVWFTHTFDPTGGQAFEGYNYLGAGLLLLLAAAAFARLRLRTAAGRPAGGGGGLRRWAPLVAVLALFALYAVGPRGWLGQWRVWAVPLPEARWAEPLALFRAHGRFFWAVGYALLAAGVTAVDKLPAASARNGVLAAALVLQAADASELLRGLHDRFSRPDRLVVPAGLTGPAFAGRGYRAYPAYHCSGGELNQTTIRQLALIAERQHGDINTASTARAPEGACVRPVPPEARVDAAPGDRRITVVLGEDGATDALTEQFRLRNDCYAFDQVWLCGRDLGSCRGSGRWRDRAWPRLRTSTPISS